MRGGRLDSRDGGKLKRHKDNSGYRMLNKSVATILPPIAIMFGRTILHDEMIEIIYFGGGLDLAKRGFSRRMGNLLTFDLKENFHLVKVSTKSDST